MYPIQQGILNKHLFTAILIINAVFVNNTNIERCAFFFFLIATAILITTNGLYRTQWKGSHCAHKTNTIRSRNQKKWHSVNEPV